MALLKIVVASKHKRQRKKSLSRFVDNRPHSIYQYSDMAPRILGQTSIFGVVFFVSKSLLGIERQKKLEKLSSLTRKPRSHVSILIYRTSVVENSMHGEHQLILVPSATRLKISLTSSSGHTRKFEVFYWLAKIECAVEIKVTKLYAFHFTSGLDGD